HSLSATLKTAGTEPLTTTDTVTNTITGSQTGITVNGVTATSLIIAGFPSPTTAGVAGNFTVTAEDGSGKVATGYTGTIHFTSSDPQAVLPSDYTFTGADAGQHTFCATLKTAGSRCLITMGSCDMSCSGSCE